MLARPLVDSFASLLHLVRGVLPRAERPAPPAATPGAPAARDVSVVDSFAGVRRTTGEGAFCPAVVPGALPMSPTFSPWSLRAASSAMTVTAEDRRELSALLRAELADDVLVSQASAAADGVLGARPDISARQLGHLLQDLVRAQAAVRGRDAQAGAAVAAEEFRVAADLLVRRPGTTLAQARALAEDRHELSALLRAELADDVLVGQASAAADGVLGARPDISARQLGHLLQDLVRAQAAVRGRGAQAGAAVAAEEFRGAADLLVRRPGTTLAQARAFGADVVEMDAVIRVELDRSALADAAAAGARSLLARRSDLAPRAVAMVLQDCVRGAASPDVGAARFHRIIGLLASRPDLDVAGARALVV